MVAAARRGGESIVRRRLTAGVAALVVVVVGGVALLYREAIAHGFSARDKPWAIEAFAARHLRRLATGLDVERRENPVAASPEILAGARDHFADHCATCHAIDGGGDTDINEGLYPPAPDLREAQTQDLSDGELFAIIRNGIRFTGMPGWGGEDTDEAIWKLVLFLRHLPDLSAEELDQMREIHPEEEHEEVEPSTHQHH
jgi:mono/diheme cytochrome c family protein